MISFPIQLLAATAARSAFAWHSEQRLSAGNARKSASGTNVARTLGRDVYRHRDRPPTSVDK